MPAMQNNLPSTFGTPLKTLADELFELKAINQDQLDQIKLKEVQTGNTQEEIITKLNIVDENTLTAAKSALYNIPFVNLETEPVSPEALSVVPQQVAERFQVFPFKIDVIAKKLSLAMADPLDLTALEFTERKTGYTITPYAGAPTKVAELIASSYSTTLAKEVTEALRDVSSESKSIGQIIQAPKGVIREEKVAEIVNHILSFAMKARASDVHIEPLEKLTRVRYRIDGILEEKLTIPRELHDGLISRIKILSGMKIDEKRIPQDGRFNFKNDGDEIDLRVSSLPVTWGEKIVMRLLKKTGAAPSLAELGLRGRALKNLEDAILKPHGIILITGPTGSGKTTTLYSIIQKISTPKINIVTLEDPVEYKIPGVNQVQIKVDAGLTFASGLRAFLRQDPNVILVGEIRDQETADLAVQAALTGHLVFSTLHTNDASGALPRLLDMHAEPYLLASSITLIVAQRVVRKIHEACKIQYAPDSKSLDDMKKVLGPMYPQTPVTNLYKGQGCPECGGTGYYSRVGIFEVLPITEKIGRLILEHASSSDIDKVAREEGMISLKQDGYMKVIDGTTSLEEVLRVAQE